MGEQTAIAWTDHTFNPWIGCQRVSPGCQHCYAETLNKRWGNDNWGKAAERRVTSDANWRQPERWHRLAEFDGVRRRVFCASMADVFENRGDLDAPRARLFELIDRTPFLDWQLLTKRPEHVNQLCPVDWLSSWPRHVWIGTTVEDQERALERIPRLIDIDAPIRFLSCEPLLGPVDLTPWLVDNCGRTDLIQWVIAGGESGAGHRPLNTAWARGLLGQCAQGGVPFFFKQVGGHTAKAGGDRLDGDTFKEFPRAVVA